MKSLTPETAPLIAEFINARPEYINAMRNTPGSADQSDYSRWSGGAEARRQLATKLGWTVPHEVGEKTQYADSPTDQVPATFNRDR